jgi:orotidine-5'-phosphate decarboxylase
MAENLYRSQLINPSDRVIEALDDMGWDEAEAQMQETGGLVGMSKSNSLHQRLGVDHAVDIMDSYGSAAMIDGKFHDTPKTVRGLVREVTEAGASLITVHASGGRAMLEAAVRGRDEGRRQIGDVWRRLPRERIGGVLGITVLTSLDHDDCVSIFGIPADDEHGIVNKVLQFADMALDAGLDGIVCSPLELEAVRSKPRFDDLLTVVPGITPQFAQKAGDQKRTASPGQAIRKGADLIVVGRGIASAAEFDVTKAEAAQAIGEEVGEALAV